MLLSCLWKAVNDVDKITEVNRLELPALILCLCMFEWELAHKYVSVVVLSLPSRTHYELKYCWGYSLLFWCDGLLVVFYAQFFTEHCTYEVYIDLQLIVCIDRELRLWFSFLLVERTLEFLSGVLYSYIILKCPSSLSVSAMADVVVRPASPSPSISLLEFKADTRLVLKSFLRHSLSIPPGERPGRIGGEYNDPNKYR